jgi:hypothetical protein
VIRSLTFLTSREIVLFEYIGGPQLKPMDLTRSECFHSNLLDHLQWKRAVLMSM